jgi:mevalonate kinase
MMQKQIRDVSVAKMQYIQTLLILVYQAFGSTLEGVADIVALVDEKADNYREKLFERIDKGEITYKQGFRKLYRCEQKALSERMLVLSSLLGSMGAKSDKVDDLKKLVDERNGFTDESGDGEGEENHKTED